MKSQSVTRNIALFAIAAAAWITVAHADESASATSADAEGLVRVKVAGLQQVYARPGADLSQYRNVMLDPIEVSFRKNWGEDTPLGREVSAEDKQKIREGLARILREELARELDKSGRYKVVTTPGDDVLRINADIRDLNINAPDTTRPGIVRSYTLSAGEMTLVADLRDSSTGALVARVIDRERDPESPWLELTTRVDNIAAARRIAQHWAEILREQLDAAHAMKGQRVG